LSKEKTPTVMHSLSLFLFRFSCNIYN